MNSETILSSVIPNKLAHQIYVQPFWNIFEEELLEFCKEDTFYSEISKCRGVIL